MRRIFAVSACFLMAMALLLWGYPWSIVHGAFTYPASRSVVAYGVTALLMTAVAMGAYFAVIGLRHRSIATWGWASLLSVAVFFIAALLLGPGGVQVPGTRVSGAFFSEWNFVTFALLSVPYSMAAAGLLVALAGEGRRR